MNIIATILWKIAWKLELIAWTLNGKSPSDWLNTEIRIKNLEVDLDFWYKMAISLEESLAIFAKEQHITDSDIKWARRLFPKEFE